MGQPAAQSTPVQQLHAEQNLVIPTGDLPLHHLLDQSLLDAGLDTDHEGTPLVMTTEAETTQHGWTRLLKGPKHTSVSLNN